VRSSVFGCDHQNRVVAHPRGVASALICFAVAVFVLFVRCLVGSAYEKSLVHLPTDFECEEAVEIPNVKAYAMCPSCNFVHEQSSLQSCKHRRTAAVACSAQPCLTVSHDATVLGPKPSMTLIRASIWLIRRHRKSSSVTSSKIRLPGSSPSGPRCRRDCDSH
jgi:hypothetical protein